MEKFFIDSVDGYKLSVHTFEISNAKAVIQIVHGMEEHQERYEKLAKILNKEGFSVVSSDMRGHGKTAKTLGFFSENEGYKLLVEDQKAITNFIKEKFADKQIYIFAHSMGTIITRVLLQTRSNDYKKVVLSGYPNYQCGAHIGIFVSSIIKAFHGAKYKSKFIQNLSVKAFNKAIKNPKTDVDWICKNEEVIQNYINDPLCGLGFTCSAFNDLFHLVVLMHKPKNYKNINSDMPILMLRGLDDPCTGGKKGSDDSFVVLKKAGFKNIERIDYQNMRHEIINEKDNEKVFDDILKFYK